MTRMEKMALMCAVLKTQLDSATTTLKARFHDPVKRWLLGTVEKAKDIDCVRAYIQADEAKTVYKLEDLDRDFRAAVAAGTITNEQLREMVAQGVIGLSKSIEMARILAPGNPELYTAVIPAGARAALKFHVTSAGRFEGLASRLSRGLNINIKDLILNAARDISSLNMDRVLAPDRRAIRSR